MGDSESVVPSA